MAIVWGDLFQGPDTHANRPAVTDVPVGSLFVCTDDDVVEINDGATWTEWYDPQETQ